MKPLAIAIAVAVIIPCAVATYWLLHEGSSMSGFFIAHFLLWTITVGVGVYAVFAGRRKRHSKDKSRPR